MSQRAHGGDRRTKSGRVTPSKLRRTAVLAADGVLAIGTGAAFGLLGGPASATAPTPGWSGIKAPLPSGPDAPNANPGVQYIRESCSSAVDCVAVGWYQDAGPVSRGLLSMRSHGSWSGIEAPLPAGAAAGAPSELFGVSCPSDASCVATGFYGDTTNGEFALIETRSGGGDWVPMTAPLPADAATAGSSRAFLKSVDCTGADSCTAVGSYKTGSGGTFGFVDTLSGGVWNSQTLPEPAGAAAHQSVELDSVSCPSVGGCVASGVYQDANTNPRALLVTQAAGGTWSAADAPLPANADASTNSGSVLFKDSCSVGVCEAVGAYKDTSGQDHALIDRYAGGVWTAIDAPAPSNAGTGANLNAAFKDVSCTFNGCVAVGAYEDNATGSRPLIDTTTSSGATTATEGPQPSDAATGANMSGVLTGVSCQSLTVCSAVGQYDTTASSTNGVALIDSSADGSWSNTPAPLPPDAATGASARSAHFTVSCPDRGGCGAAGDYVDSSGHQQGLLADDTPAEGYWTNAADGGVFTYGNAEFHGSAGNIRLNRPVVGMAATPGGGGYWEVATDGGIFSYGDAQFYGSTGSLQLNKPIVGMARTPDGGGYWLVASDGGIFSYGDAQFYGSTGSIRLNQPVVGMAATPDGKGYWLVATDGGIFAYGDAQFYGSRGGQPLNKPIVGMASTPTGLGYWLVASDGGIFSYGDAQFYGSTGAIRLNKPIVSMMTSFDGGGYWLVASDGGIFSYGDTGFYGSTGSLQLNQPMVNGAPT